jgi:hypothetical protein
VVNFSDAPVPLPADLAAGEVIVASAESEPGTVAGATTVWLAHP